MTREQYIRLETSRFVLEKYYNAGQNDKPFDVTLFLASTQMTVIGLDEMLRRHIAELPREEVDPTEREALLTTHTHRVVLLCHKIGLLEKLSEHALKLSTKPGSTTDNCLMLRIFGLAGAIRGELHTMERHILY